MAGSFARPKKMSDFYIPPFWGDGSDGILSSGATYQAGVDFEKYSGFCIKQFKEILWNPADAQTLTVDEPCRGLVLMVNGDVNIGANATISMAKKGSILPCNPEELIDRFHESRQMRYIVDVLKTLRGGAGGDGGRGVVEQPGSLGGTGGIGRICQGGRGGGGGGGAISSGGSGGNGGSIVYPECMGYPGHNGTKTTKNPSVTRNGFNGGGGGNQGDEGGGGGVPWGAGGGGGSSRWSSDTHPSADGLDGEHTGGFILIIARGSVFITGTIDVTGGNGGDGGMPNYTDGGYLGGGGGGAGGGVIAIFSQTAIDVLSATVNKSGGPGGQAGTSARPGTGGQQGTVYTEVL